MKDEAEDIFSGRCSPAAVTGGPFNFAAPHWRDTGQCSHCGGERPSTVLKLIREGKVTIEPTDKNYKIYVRGLNSPANPASKCYLNHFSRAQAIEFVTLFETGQMKVDYPGHFYSGLCWAEYKEDILKAVALIRGRN